MNNTEKNSAMRYIVKSVLTIIMQCFLTLIILGVIGLIAFIIGLFIAGANGFAYIAVVAAMTVALCLYIVMKIWKISKPKIRYMVSGGLFALAVLAIPALELYYNYHDNIDRVDVEQEINLWHYEPFRENTKAVSLDEPSALQLTENLPRLDGATALYPLYAAFARAVYPERQYYIKENNIVDCSNTIGAYEKLLRGEADIIFAASPSAKQFQMAEDAGNELIFTPIGLEAFVFFVNSNNPIDGLSSDDIRRIYSGQATNWREFGGANTKIQAFQRDENSGSQTALVAMMGNTPLMNPPKEDVISMMGGMTSRVSSYRNYKNALGYSFLFYATEMSNDNKIKLLSVDGIAPTRENVTNRTYPHADFFFAVTTAGGSDNPNTLRLIEWILSEQGQYLVQKTGYTPLNTK